MSNWHRFWIGGGGALLPLLVTLLAVDLSGIIDNASHYTVGIYVGALIRYLAMFAAGGIVAALNNDEQSPIKLVQLGIAAPALIASYVNAQSPAAAAPTPATSTHSSSIALVSTASAKEIQTPPARIIVAGGFFTDVFRGATNSLPALVAKPTLQVNKADQEALARALEEAKKSAAQAATAANKAAVAAGKAASEPSSEAASASKKSAADSALAAEKANMDVKALQDAAKAMK